ncbi:MAG: hypothetical protein HOV87_26495 [Catenulispora sp.]|nr:hypothetical protein [Catenulispora sp.]
MTTLNGFPYAELSFGADGATSDPAQGGVAPALALDADVSDLLVLSHGWNDDAPAARSVYDGLTAAMARCGDAPPGLAVLGLLWPAKRYDAAPSVAATVAADPTGHAAAAFVAGVRSQVGADLGTIPAAPGWADPGDQQEAFFGMDPHALLRRFDSIEDGIAGVLNLATYYEMKARSGAVGRGLAGVLTAIRAARPYLRLHLAGHSFGARVMASALAAAAPLPVSSATLIQGAFSHYGLAQHWDGVHDGLFRPALTGDRLTGPMVVTYSHHDEALGIAYALASRLADQPDSALGPIGGPHDHFGALGANGALATPESVWAPMTGFGGQAYAFTAGAVNNLESSAYILSHTAISCTEVGMAILGAINTNEIGTTEAG